MSVTVERAAGALGAYVTGIDIAALDDRDVEALRLALLDHLVVFLPDQDVGAEELERLAEALGGSTAHDYVGSLRRHPGVMRVVTEPEDTVNYGGGWHSDLSFLAEPPSFTALHAQEVPAVGGDTVWSNQYLAYERLSEGLREALDGLRALHSAEPVFGKGAIYDRAKRRTSTTVRRSAGPDARCSHPVVRVHPETRRPALYVNPAFTVRLDGWTRPESRPLLEMLYRFATSEQLTCRLRWRRHMLAIWDNRCTLHKALHDYQGARREMLRATVRGTVPVGPARSQSFQTGS